MELLKAGGYTGQHLHFAVQLQAPNSRADLAAGSRMLLR